MNPRFTVLMPTNYRPDAIGCAIQSVLNQTEPDFELLVVGDGAVPGTAEVVLSFADPRIRWFDFPKGPAFGYANRNIALKQARGDLIAYCADDDLMFPDHLALLGPAFDDPSIQWAYSQAIWVSADGIAGPDLTNLSFADERAHFREANTICGGAVIFRASAFPSRDAFPEHVPTMADWTMFSYLLDTYGPDAMKVVRQATLFHFTAGRKKSRDSSFQLLRSYLAIADRDGWWPEALRLKVPPGALVQDVYAEMLKGPNGPSAFRTAAQDTVSRIALERASTRLKPRETLPPEKEDFSEEASNLRAELAALRSSTSWRVTAPIRKLVSLFRSA